MMSDSEESIEREIFGDDYGPGVLDEPSTYRPEKGDDEEGLSSTLAAGTDVDRLQDGGQHPERGTLTTTGGHAGPNSFRSHPRTGPGVANTTTGDATTGALDPPADGYTSDNTSSAVE
jgi:hypothetical protein